MVNRPEDRPKVIALSIAIAFLILYFFFSVVPKVLESGKTQAPAPVTSAPHADATPPATPVGSISTGTPVAMATGATGAGRSPSLDAEANTTGGSFPAAPRDPFQPPVPTEPAGAPRSGVAPVKPASFHAASIIPTTPLPNIGASISGAGTEPLKVMPAPPPPLPDVTLKGVMPGNPAVAVLAVAGQTLSLQEGEEMSPGVRITHIAEAGVVLQQGKNRFILEVGHTLKSGGPASGSGLASTPLPAGFGITQSSPKSTAEKPATTPNVEEVASSTPSSETRGDNPPPHPVHRHFRRHRMALYIRWRGHFVRYHPGEHPHHALYVRRHGHFMRYHRRHHRPL